MLYEVITDCKSWATVYLAAHPDVSSVLSNNTQRDGKPQACTFTLWFCCKERIKNMGFDMIRDADAAIGKVYLKITALSDGIGLDNQGPSIGHCINGI